MLASYPNNELDIPALSIYGSEDKVLNAEKYEEARAKGFWPTDLTEYVITGGYFSVTGSLGVNVTLRAISIPFAKR